MDNKRWGKRFSTIFWWSFTILPLVVALIYFIGYHFTFNSGIATADELVAYHDNSNGDFLHFLENILYNNSSSFKIFVLSPLFNAFRLLFNRLGVVSRADVMASLFAWMASVQMYHLMFDFFAWLPRLFHSWMERWCKD